MIETDLIKMTSMDKMWELENNLKNRETVKCSVCGWVGIKYAFSWDKDLKAYCVNHSNLNKRRE